MGLTRREFLRLAGGVGAGVALFPKETARAAGYRGEGFPAAGREGIFSRGPETYPLPDCGVEVYNAAVFDNWLTFAGMDKQTAADLKKAVEEGGVRLLRVQAATARVGKTGGEVSDFLTPRTDFLADIIVSQAAGFAERDQRLREVRLRVATPSVIMAEGEAPRLFAPWHLEGVVDLPRPDSRGAIYATLAAGVNSARWEQGSFGPVEALEGPDWEKIELVEGDPAVHPSPQQVETPWGRVFVAENRSMEDGSGTQRGILVVFPSDSGRDPSPKWGDSFNQSGPTEFSVTPSAAGATVSYWARRGRWRGVEVMDIKDPGGAEDAVSRPRRLPPLEDMLDYLAKTEVREGLVRVSSRVPTAVLPLDDTFYRLYFPAQDSWGRARLCSMVLRADEDELVIPQSRGAESRVFGLPGEVDPWSLSNLSVRVREGSEEVVVFSGLVGGVSRALWALTAGDGQVDRLTDPQKTNLLNVRVGTSDIQVLLKSRENYRRDNQPFVWAWPLS